MEPQASDKITDSALFSPPIEVSTTGRCQSLLERALGRESAELARLYLGDSQVVNLVNHAEEAAAAQLRTVFQMPLDQEAEFSRVFAVKLKQLMKGPCGGDLEAPRAR